MFTANADSNKPSSTDAKALGWTQYLWGLGIASIPFVVVAGRLVQDSLSDVPEAYLIWIPVVAGFWIIWQLQQHKGNYTPRTATPALIMAAIAGVGAFLAWGLYGIVPARFNQGALLAWPLWMALVMAMLYGPNVLGVIYQPLLYLYLVWPPLYIAILNVLNPLLERFSDGLFNALNRQVSWVLQTATKGSYWVQHGTHWIPINITAACSGSDSILALLVLFPVALLVFHMSRGQQWLLILGGSLLAFIANNLRILVIFWAAHQWGSYIAFSIIHPVLGPLLFVALVLVLLGYGGRRVRLVTPGSAWHRFPMVRGRISVAIAASLGLALAIGVWASPFSR